MFKRKFYPLFAVPRLYYCSTMLVHRNPTDVILLVLVVCCVSGLVAFGWAYEISIVFSQAGISGFEEEFCPED